MKFRKMNQRLNALLIRIAGLVTITLASNAAPTNVVFIHPDGSGMAGWVAHRMLEFGPDAMSNWDRLERVSLYRGHQRDSLNTSSHAGATAHAYGIRVPTDSFGMFGTEPLKSLSGFEGSLMHEAKSRGLFVSLVNSGHLCEPGTAVYAASAKSRRDTDSISEQVVRSGFDVLFAGGEVLLLPEGVMGHHGKRGIRKDGQNLVEVARSLGYRVIFTKDELLSLDPNKDQKVFGVFAALDTYNDMPEEQQQEKGLPHYDPAAPTVGEMLSASLQIARASGKQFFIVAEEEGTDNLANDCNASGMLEAYRRADLAIGVTLEYMEQCPDTLLVTAADSEAAGPEVLSPASAGSRYFAPDKPLPPHSPNGAPMDGVSGTGSFPFVSKPDQFGKTHTFAISWSDSSDMAGGVIARAHGKQSDLLGIHVENTGIYRLMFEALFGVRLEPEPAIHP